MTRLWRHGLFAAAPAKSRTLDCQQAACTGDCACRVVLTRASPMLREIRPGWMRSTAGAIRHLVDADDVVLELDELPQFAQHNTPVRQLAPHTVAGFDGVQARQALQKHALASVYAG